MSFAVVDARRRSSQKQPQNLTNVIYLFLNNFYHVQRTHGDISAAFQAERGTPKNANVEDRIISVKNFWHLKLERFAVVGCVDSARTVR